MADTNPTDISLRPYADIQQASAKERAPLTLAEITEVYRKAYDRCLAAHVEELNVAVEVAVATSARSVDYSISIMEGEWKAGFVLVNDMAIKGYPFTLLYLDSAWQLHIRLDGPVAQSRMYRPASLYCFDTEMTETQKLSKLKKLYLDVMNDPSLETGISLAIA